MKKQHQNNLFQSFSQADDTVTRQFGGTGLGLAISKQLTELMGGKIWFNSEHNKGTTFHFTAHFECQLKSKDSLAITNTKLNTEVLSKLKVLVVDDSDIARDVLLDVLARNKITAEGVENGELAVNQVLAARADEQPYDLVLMDWKMPLMDGIAAAKKIHLHTGKQLPQVLMISAHDKYEAKLLGEGAGITTFLEKPVNHTLLLESIINMVNNEQETLAIETNQSKNKVPNLSAYRVLLVEDNPINQQVAKEFLNDTGIAIDCAENGLIALDKLTTGQYDIVLMDIQMPEMDGLTAAKEIRTTLNMPDIPIIAMTAHAMAGDVEQSVVAGMDHHLTKPIEPEILYQTLAYYLSDEQENNTIRGKDAVVYEQAEALKKKQTLKTLTSLHVDQAIQQIQGKLTLYLQLVADFWKNNQQLSATMQALYNKDALAELYRCAHSLKSTAQYIGASSLSDAASQLENEIKLKGLQIKATLANVINELDLVIGELNKIYQVVDQSEITRELDVEATANLFTKILPLLHSGDILAEDMSVQLIKIAEQTQYAKQISHIHQLITDFDFEEAISAVVQFQKELTHE